MVQGMELRNFRRGRHRYSAGWPSRWALAHIVVYYITYIDVDIEATACAHTADMIRLRPNFWPRLWPQVEVNILALSEAVARMLRRRTMLQGLGRDRGQYSGLGQDQNVEAEDNLTRLLAAVQRLRPIFWSSPWPWSRCTDTSDRRHFGPKTLRYHRDGSKMSGQFGIGAEASIRLFGTSVELSLVRSQDHLAKPFTPFRGALTSSQLISNRHRVKLSSFALNRAVRQTSVICAADIARQQHRPEQGLDVICVTSNQGHTYVHKVE